MFKFARNCLEIGRSNWDFNKSHHRSGFILESIARCGFKLPKNYDAMKNEMICELSEKINNNQRFSLSLDEWTRSGTKKYVNVTLHGDATEETYNLGLARIFGSCTTTYLLEAVTNQLALFGVNYEHHIVGSAGDGASTMVKLGKECPTFYQLCLNHGV
jgi:hypothetical protein